MATHEDKIVGGLISNPGQYAGAGDTNVAPTLVNDIIIAAAPPHGIILYGFDGRNTDSSAKWIMVFDSATLPANGTAPLHCIGVPPAGTTTSAGMGNFGFTTASIYGEKFRNGIVVAVSTSDVTLTIDSATKTILCVDYDKFQ